MNRVTPLLGPLFGLMFIGYCVYLVMAPVPIDPRPRPADRFDEAAWHPEPFPEITRIDITDGHGPEDVDVDSRGRVVGGLDDGRILRWPAGGGEPEVFADTGGRPLGLHWDRGGNLLVADAHKGLLRVSPAGKVKVLATRCGNVPMAFTDDLETDARGRIWFSDASVKFGQGDWKLDIVEGNPNGRLCRYDPGASEAVEVVPDLFFANGVAVDPRNRFVLVNETNRHRVLKVPLEPPHTPEVFIEGLPGYPDGISSGTDGLFWIALVNGRNGFLDATTDKPWARKLVLRLPLFVQPKPIHTARFLGVNDEGQVVHDFFDPEGSRFYMVTSVQEHDGELYLGSLTDNAWAHLPVP